MKSKPTQKGCWERCCFIVQRPTRRKCWMRRSRRQPEEPPVAVYAFALPRLSKMPPTYHRMSSSYGIEVPRPPDRWRKVRREKALDFGGFELPRTGSLHPMAIE